MMMHQTIKVEGQLQTPMFYQPGDIVIGKCKNNPPWPAVIQCFKGYDEDEVQVFTVDFFVERSYAHLQTYLITPLTDSNLAKMKNRFLHHKSIRIALQMAEASISTMFKNAKDSPQQLQRLNKLYHPLKDAKFNLFQDVDKYIHKGLKRTRQFQNYNTQLMPKLQKFYYDKDGNKKKSKQFAKRRLRLHRSIIDISVQIFQAQTIGKRKRITTKICEGPNMSIATSKRMFVKNPFKSTVNTYSIGMEQQRIQVRDVTYFNMPEESHKKGELRIMKTAQLTS